MKDLDSVVYWQGSVSRSVVTGARNGQVLVVSIVAFVVLMTVAVLVVDVGYLFATRAEIQNAADAASKAALLELWEERASGESEKDARVAARKEKTDMAEYNKQGVGTAAKFGSWDGNSFTAYDTATAANAVHVRAFLNGNAPGGALKTLFAGFLGRDTVSLSAEAIAHFIHRGLAPFAIYSGELAPKGASVTLYNDTEVAPGAFGLLDFNGGSNSASDTKDWVRYGYTGPFYIDPEDGSLTVDGTTGLTSSVASAINYHISEGDEIVTPVYDSLWGKAQDTHFAIIGYAKLVITGLTWQEDNPEEIESITATITGKYIVGSGDTEGSLRDFLRLQLVH